MFWEGAGILSPSLNSDSFEDKACARQILESGIKGEETGQREGQLKDDHGIVH